MSNCTLKASSKDEQMFCNITSYIDNTFFCMSQCPLSNSNISNLSGMSEEISGLLNI